MSATISKEENNDCVGVVLGFGKGVRHQASDALSILKDIYEITIEVKTRFRLWTSSVKEGESHLIVVFARLRIELGRNVDGNAFRGSSLQSCKMRDCVVDEGKE